MSKEQVLMQVHGLWHFHGFTLGDRLNAEAHNGKFIGTYATEVEAQRAIERVRSKPGFRDYPDGFHLFGFDVNRTYWAEGFLPGDFVQDEAIAADSSGIFGNDAALADNANDTDRDFDEYTHFLALKPQPDLQEDLWELSHYKISRENGQDFEDMGYKLIGFYSTRRNAEDAIAMLRAKPGFSSHPEGFRLRWTRIGDIYWKDGFA